MFISRIFNSIEKNQINCSVVVVAAGNSARFGSDKLFAKIGNIPVLAHSLLALQKNEFVSEIVVVTSSDRIEAVGELCNNYRISKAEKIILGGNTRVESALAGASEANPDATLLAVHDAARPMVSDELITRVIKSAHRFHTAVPVIPVKDTIKSVYGGRIKHTPDRKNLFAAQTPQVFIPEILKGALTNALQKELTISDDSSAVELLGESVHICEGDEQNIKITTPFDLVVAETIYQDRRTKMFAERGITIEPALQTNQLAENE